jgi:hypothetical protein
MEESESGFARIVAHPEVGHKCLASSSVELGLIVNHRFDTLILDGSPVWTRLELAELSCRKLVIVSTARQEGIKTLYHYQGCSLEYLKDTLIRNRVRCSNPEDLNDPWDCRPYFDDRDLADSLRREAWAKSFNSYIDLQVPADKQAEARAAIASWRRNDKPVELMVKKLTLATWTWIVESHMIYCLTPHPDSLLMWAHYGDKHKGMCLEFDAKFHFGRAYQVNYADKLPVIGPDGAMDGKALIGPFFCTKSSEWHYEDEYRLVLTMIDDGGGKPASLSLQGNYLILPPKVLTAIIAGYEADVGAIRAMVQEHAPGIAVKRAVRRLNEYHLDIVDDSAARYTNGD